VIQKDSGIGIIKQHTLAVGLCECGRLIVGFVIPDHECFGTGIVEVLNGES